MDFPNIVFFTYFALGLAKVFLMTQIIIMHKIIITFLGRIYTVTDKKYLLVATESSLTYQERWKVRPVINSTTNETFILGKDDHMTLPTYHGYSYSLKGWFFALKLFK